MQNEPPSLLIREASPKTPDIYFNMPAGMLLIKGRSIPEDSFEYYMPLIRWLDAWTVRAKTITHTVTASFCIEYQNSASGKMLFEFMRKLIKLHNGGVSVIVNWYCLDEYMLEAGEEYRNLINIPFNLIECM
jgi:hypothetical protein